jgi:hypothetical protein
MNRFNAFAKLILPGALAVAISAHVAAQPVVTGNLTLYYAFDEIVTMGDGIRQFVDKSGNDFPGTIYEGDPAADSDPGTLTLETDNPVRGAGAARLQQSSNSGDLPVFVDVDGRRITEEFPDLLPTSGLNGLSGLTIAAWLNVTSNEAGDQSVFQARTSDAGHGAPHFQLQGNGKLRMTFRSQSGGNVVNTQLFIDGSEDSGARYPVDEWFHYAGTYDAVANSWAMYYNGNQIGAGQGTGEELGDWGGLDSDLFSAGLGAVYDSGGRRFDGLMDELYVFNRALTADEIQQLVNPPAPVECGDFNDDGVVDTADYEILTSNFNTRGGFEVGDCTFDGRIDLKDFLEFRVAFAAAQQGVAAVPEPTAACLAVLGLLATLAWRTRAAG